MLPEMLLRGLAMERLPQPQIAKRLWIKRLRPLLPCSLHPCSQAGKMMPLLRRLQQQMASPPVEPNAYPPRLKRCSKSQEYQMLIRALSLLRLPGQRSHLAVDRSTCSRCQMTKGLGLHQSPNPAQTSRAAAKVASGELRVEAPAAKPAAGASTSMTNSKSSRCHIPLGQPTSSCGIDSTGADLYVCSGWDRLLCPVSRLPKLMRRVESIADVALVYLLVSPSYGRCGICNRNSHSGVLRSVAHARFLYHHTPWRVGRHQCPQRTILNHSSLKVRLAVAIQHLSTWLM